MKIAAKISLSFLCTAIILATIFITIFYFVVKDSFLSTVDARLDALVYARAQHIETYLDMLATSTNQLTKSVVLENLLKADKKNAAAYKEAFEAAMARLIRTKEANPSIEEFLLLDKTGKVIVSSDKMDIGADMSADAIFTGGQRKVYLKDVYYSETFKKGLMGVSGPAVDSKTGEFLGVVAAKVDLKNLYKIVTNSAGFGKTEEMFILNKYGYMITPSRFLTDTFLKQKVDTENSRSCIRDKAMGGSCNMMGALIVAPDYRGVMIAGSNAYIPRMQWSLISKIDRDEVLESLKTLSRIAMIIILMAPLLAWLFGLFFSSIIIKPLHKLRKGTEVIGSGNLNYQIDIDTKDEIGELSRAFNVMTGDLKHTTTSVNKLNEEIVRRKAIENQLAASAQEWEATFNSIPDLISIYDKNYRILKVNKAYADFFKVPAEKLIGQFCYKVVHGTVEPFEGCPHKKTLETKQPQVMETFEPRLGMYIEASTSPIFDDNKEIVGTVHIIKNITARRNADLASHRLAAIVESSDDAIVGKDLDSIILTWNKGAEHLYGYTAKEAIGKHVSIIVPPELQQELDMIMQKVKEDKPVEHLETLRRKKDGTDIPVSLTISPIKDNDGRVTGASTIAHDITEHKKMEELLQKYNEDLEKEVEERTRELKESQDRLVRSEKLAIVGKLASSVAHELRNPLGVIKNVVYYLNMLEEAKRNPEIKENLDIVAQEIDNSDKIITDLLEFSRAKAPVMRPESINLIVKEVLDRIRIGPGIELTLGLKEGLPDIDVDALQMHQVFYNLIKNAIEAMDKGGKLTINTALKGNFVEVSLSDTGFGISKENLTKIFEPLFSTKTKGTGLGLSVCASLVERHNGKIEVDSEVGKGTTFTVKLPVKRA